MTQAPKVCPKCGAVVQPNAIYCSMCGTPLQQNLLRSQDLSELVRPRSGYEQKYGEADLLETNDGRKGGQLAALLILGASLFACGLLTVFGVTRFIESTRPPTHTDTQAIIAEDTVELVISTNTAFPTLNLPTVTLPPPTSTATETPGPCRVVVAPGADLIALASYCGHRSLDVIPLILTLNGISAPENIQSGQQLDIPWPTSTVDPNAPTATTVVSSSLANFQARSSSDSIASINGTPINTLEPPTPIPTPTLPLGVGFHSIIGGESMVSIAISYNTSAEVLSQLNPEIPFTQCDFSVFSGGPACTVQLSVGQQIRVPIPTPLPTETPTPSGSETATPTITPTFNAPSPLSPGNGALFLAGQLVTLRWVTTGTLGPRDVYRVEVRDLTIDQTYLIDTTELSVIVSESWQGTDGRRHVYSWRVSVINLDTNQVYFTTEPREFTWVGREAR